MTIPKIEVKYVKGVVDFFLGLIMFMGCSLTYVNALFEKKINK